jgi:XTP/dITP diphosphohydrolase
MKKILIATHNPGKLQEIQEFLLDLPLELVSLSDLQITHDVKEDGTTYEENSQKKALTYAKLSGLPAVSDDGGLEIAALGGEPGIKSRRWLGYHASDEELIEHLKKVANTLPKNNRNAKFVTVVTLALPTGEVWSSRAEIKGVIAKKPLINKMEGLPYRSFFFLPEIQKFYYESELTPDEKVTYNHRRKAVHGLIPSIQKHILAE